MGLDELARYAIAFLFVVAITLGVIFGIGNK